MRVADGKLCVALDSFLNGAVRDGRVFFNEVAVRVQPTRKLHLAALAEKDESAFHTCELQRQLQQRSKNIFDRSAGVQLPRGAQQPVQLLHFAGRGGAFFALSRKFGDRGKQAGHHAGGRGRPPFPNPVKKEIKARRLQRSQLQHIARLQHRLLNALAVQVNPVAAAPVHNRIGRAFRDDDRMLPRDKWIEQNDILAGGSAKRCGGYFEFYGVLPVCIGIA